MSEIAYLCFQSPTPFTSWFLTMGQRALWVRPHPPAAGYSPGGWDSCQGNQVSGLVFASVQIRGGAPWKILELEAYSAEMSLAPFVTRSPKLLGLFSMTHTEKGKDSPSHFFLQLLIAVALAGWGWVGGAPVPLPSPAGPEALGLKPRLPLLNHLGRWLSECQDPPRTPTARPYSRSVMGMDYGRRHTCAKLGGKEGGWHAMPSREI